MTQPLLEISNLKVRIGAGDNAIRAVDDVSFHINRGETFALLGESGCGKSMTALSILRLLPEPAGRITGGRIVLDSKDLTALPEVDMRGIRGRRIAMIFQEPMTSLNPVLSVGKQIGETLRQHHGLKGRVGRERVLDLLDAVGIPDVRQRIDAYPHQLSGGMKQRIMIAIALAGEPDLLIADEPTTALDVTIQAQVLELLQKLQQDTHMAIMLITHDTTWASSPAWPTGPRSCTPGNWSRRPHVTASSVTPATPTAASCSSRCRMSANGHRHCKPSAVPCRHWTMTSAVVALPSAAIMRGHIAAVKRQPGISPITTQTITHAATW
jgi:ABC-type dipeptide/oligopeptide/nickel transport system ATPase subunit